MTSTEFEILVNRAKPRLIFFAKGFVGKGAATAEDMVQDAVIKLWGLTNKEDVKNPEAMLWRILRNTCLDYIKLKKNNVDALDCNSKVYSEGSPLRDIEVREEISFAHRLMNTLSADQMMVLRLRDIMGYEMCEIAKVLDITEGNVRTLLSRARKNLRAQFKELECKKSDE